MKENQVRYSEKDFVISSMDTVHEGMKLDKRNGSTSVPTEQSYCHFT